MLEMLFRGLSSSTSTTFILIQELEAQLLFSMGLLELIALGNFTSRLLKQPERSLFFLGNLSFIVEKTYFVIGVEKEGFTLTSRHEFEKFCRMGFSCFFFLLLS